MHLKFLQIELASEILPKESFGYSVIKAIDSGFVTTNAKKKIVTRLRDMMLLHAIKPSGAQYNTALLKLIEKYPKLKDDINSLSSS